jgi:hypothetical protein|nr:MAG TPA: Putative ATPase subunit of terminase (gpP-like) [Caudoviricetes sp.]
MGIMDAFNAEDRTQIKVSSLYAMLKEGAKAEYLLNAVKCEVPYQYIVQMATGKSGELQDYKDTQLTPDNIKELQSNYDKLCADVQKYKEENKGLLQSLEQAQNASTVDSASDVDEQATPETADSINDTEGGDAHQEKKKIDIGKIMALKNAGWKVKDIADEMHMDPQAVSNAIWRYNKQNDN